MDQVGIDHNRIGGNMNYIPLIILDALILPIIPFLHPVGAAYQIIFRKEKDTVDTSMFIYRMILDCQSHPLCQL